MKVTNILLLVSALILTFNSVSVQAGVAKGAVKGTLTKPGNPGGPCKPSTECPSPFRPR